MVNLWGSRYLLPASLSSPTEIVADPGVGFTVFNTHGSGSSEDYVTGGQVPYPAFAVLGSFGNILDPLGVKPWVDAGQGGETPDMSELAAMPLGDGLIVVSTPGGVSSGVAGTWDNDNRVVIQAFDENLNTDSFYARVPGAIESSPQAFQIDQLSDDGFIASWSYGSDIQWLTTSSTGTVIGANISSLQTLSSSSADYGDHDFIVLDDGRVLLIYQNGNDDEIYGQFLNDSGLTLVATPFQINAVSQDTGFFTSGPVAVQLGGGEVLVAWIDGNGDARAQRISETTGVRIGTELALSTNHVNRDADLHVVALPDGGALYVWEDTYTAQHPGSSVRAQQVDASGNLVGGELVVDQTGFNNHEIFQVEGLGDGRIVISYGNSQSDYLQILDTRTTHSFTGTEASDVIVGSDHGTQISALGGNDKIYGVSGNDILDGGLGADSMIGGTGNDTYYVDNAGDRVIEGLNSGSDHAFSTVSLALPNNVENLTLTNFAWTSGTGNTLANTLEGNAGRNTLTGLAGNDTLLGGQGDDVLIGGAGKDTMTGGGGLDRMAISSLSESGVTFAQRDVINTFAHGDKIDVSAIDANTHLAGNQAFTFVSAFTGVAGQLQWDLTNISPTGVKGYLVQGDVNGDATADFSLQIYTSPTDHLPGGSAGWHLAAWDFIL